MTIQCCKCFKIKSDNQWTPKNVMLGGEVSHTYCPECRDHTLAEIVRDYAQSTAF